jgi:ferredoxin
VNNTSSKSAQTRAVIYDSLAQTMADPAMMAGFPGQSPLAEAVVQGAKILGSAACRRAMFSLEELPPVAGADLRRRFELVVSRPGQRPISLHESLAVTGHLVGPPTQETERFYRKFGVETMNDLPDSASVELSFLAFLAEREAQALESGHEGEVRQTRRELRAFLTDHVMRWLPQVGRALAVSGDPYFTVIGTLLEEFLKEEQLRLLTPRNGATNADIPFVVCADLCSLCGFCVQTCPTGALLVTETDRDTNLVLDPTRCIGCAKCLPVCPDNALGMMPRMGVASRAVIMRQSPRARCPRCNEFTVSQAELDAVFTRLEADAELRYRLSLCNRCKGY